MVLNKTQLVADVRSADERRDWFVRSPDSSMITVGSEDERAIMCQFIGRWRKYESNIRLMKNSYYPYKTAIHERYIKQLLGAILSFYRYYKKAQGARKPIFDYFILSLHEAMEHICTILHGSKQKEVMALPDDDKNNIIIRTYDMAVLLLQIASEYEPYAAESYQGFLNDHLQVSCRLRGVEFDPTHKRQELQRICRELPSSFDAETLEGRMAHACLATQVEKYNKEGVEAARQVATQAASQKPISTPAKPSDRASSKVPFFQELHSPPSGIRRRHNITPSLQRDIVGRKGNPATPINAAQPLQSIFGSLFSPCARSFFYSRRCLSYYASDPRIYTFTTNRKIYNPQAISRI